MLITDGAMEEKERGRKRDRGRGRYTKGHSGAPKEVRGQGAGDSCGSMQGEQSR